MKSQRKVGSQNGQKRFSLALSSSSTNAANSSSLSSEPTSHFSSPEAGRGAAGRRLMEHRDPPAQVAVVAGSGSMAPQPQLRPASHLPTQRANLLSGPESLVPRAMLACHNNCPSSQELLAATSGNLLARKPRAQLKCPGSAAQADGSAKEAGMDLGRAEEEEGLKRGFVTRQEFLVMERELEAVQEELRCLRWRVRRMGETVQPLAEESKRYNGYTLMELKSMVQSEEDSCRAAQKFLMALFSEVYLPDQACNARSLPPHNIDPELYTVYWDILQSIFPGISSHTPRERTQ